MNDMRDDDDDGLGFGFYARLAGISLGIAIAVGIVLLIFFRAIYAWGLIGVFAVLAVIILLIGWIHDRRSAAVD